MKKRDGSKKRGGLSELASRGSGTGRSATKEESTRARAVETGAGDQGATLGIESTIYASEGDELDKRRYAGERSSPSPLRGGEVRQKTATLGTRATRNKSNERTAKQLSAAPRRARVITVSVPSGADVLQIESEPSLGVPPIFYFSSSPLLPSSSFVSYFSFA